MRCRLETAGQSWLRGDVVLFLEREQPKRRCSVSREGATERPRRRSSVVLTLRQVSASENLVLVNTSWSAGIPRG